MISFRKADIIDRIRPFLRGEEIVKRTDKLMYDTIFRLAK